MIPENPQVTRPLLIKKASILNAGLFLFSFQWLLISNRQIRLDSDFVKPIHLNAKPCECLDHILAKEQEVYHDGCYEFSI